MKRTIDEKVIVKTSFEIFCRKICSRYMILPEDRDMRFGIEVDLELA